MQCGENNKGIEYIRPQILSPPKNIMYIVVRNVGSRILMRMPNAIARDVLCLSTVNYQLKDGIKKTVKVCQDTMTKNYTRLIYTVREAQNMYETASIRLSVPLMTNNSELTNTEIELTQP